MVRILTFCWCFSEVPGSLSRPRANKTRLWRVPSWAPKLLLFSRVQLFATPWTAARQACLSFTISWSLLRLMSVELMMPSNHLVLCHLLLLLPSVFLRIRLFGGRKIFPSSLLGSLTGLIIKLTQDRLAGGKNELNFIHFKVHKNRRLQKVTKAGNFIPFKQRNNPFVINQLNKGVCTRGSTLLKK